MTELGEIARRLASFDQWLEQHGIVLNTAQRALADNVVLAMLPMSGRMSGRSFALQTAEQFFDDVMRP